MRFLIAKSFKLSQGLAEACLCEMWQTLTVKIVWFLGEDGEVRGWQLIYADLIDAICGRMQMATQTWVMQMMIMRSRCQGLAGSDLMSTEHIWTQNTKGTRQGHVVQGNGMSVLVCLRQDVRKQDGAQEPFMLYCQTQTMATQIWISNWSWKGTSKTTFESSMCICCRVAYFDYFDLLLTLMLENAKRCKTFMSEHIRYWPAPHSGAVRSQALGNGLKGREVKTCLSYQNGSPSLLASLFVTLRLRCCSSLCISRLQYPAIISKSTAI